VNLVNNIGSQFNDKQWRFFKAVIFESAIETFSGGRVKYVGQEKDGCDFIIPSLNNVKVEMKYTEDVLYTERSNIARTLTKSITLLNSKGTNTHSGLPSDYSNFILVVGRRGGAVIDKPTLSNYLDIKGDSITAVIPTDKMVFVFTPTTISQSSENLNVNLKQEILDTIARSLSSFL